MSVFGDFQRVWMQRFPDSGLPAAWEEDVRANLSKHRQKVAELKEELEKELFYVEYLERLLSDVEKHRAVGQPSRSAPSPPSGESLQADKDVQNDNKESPTKMSGIGEREAEGNGEESGDADEVVLRHGDSGARGHSRAHRNSINQCISELTTQGSAANNVSRRCASELPPKREIDKSETKASPPGKTRPISQGSGGDFVTVIEVNGVKGAPPGTGSTASDASNKATPNNKEEPAISVENVPPKKKIPPRPPPKMFGKRSASSGVGVQEEGSPPTSLDGPRLRNAESKESITSHSSSHGTPSITERVKSFESINSVGSGSGDRKQNRVGGAGTPQSLEEGEVEMIASLESLPGEEVAHETEQTQEHEPFYDQVPMDVNDGEYVYIQAGGTNSSTDDVSSNSSTLPIAAARARETLDPPESPGNNSNYVNIDYFLQRGVGRTDTQRSAGSADSEGDLDDAPPLFRSISVDTEPSTPLPIPHLPPPVRNTHDTSGGSSAVSTGEAERLTMHRCIVTSIIESENVYVECLYVMEKYMSAIKATLNSSQPVISEEEFNTIFYKIPELHHLHKSFLKGLQADVNSFQEPLTVGIHFKKMAENINIYGAFLHNYGNATGAVRKCCTSSSKFRDLTQHIACRGQEMSLEDLLHKPVARVQKNALVLHDLLKYTPTSHPDHAMLTEALNMTQHFLDEFNYVGTHRKLVRNSFIVELADGHRKLRHLFLFNDVIACAKYKASGREKFTFELKWFIPLQDAVVCEVQETPGETREATAANIVSLKSQACTVRDQIMLEEKAFDDKKASKVSVNRSADKHRKKLADLEGQLVLASPNLVFRVSSRSAQRTFIFFLSSDYERTQWIDTIHQLQSSAPPIPSGGGGNGTGLTMLDLQAHILACRNYLEADMGSYLLRSRRDEGLLLGDLHLHIGELMKPLDIAADTYVCVEVDSYGHYFRKAKSKLVCNSTQPRWNETFVIELEGSLNVRVLLYQDSGGLRPQLRGKNTLKLTREWLGEQQCHRTLTLGTNIMMTIWVRFVPSEVTLRRVPTAKPGALFGAKIQQVCKRQKRDIPFIVTSCVREVDRRGMTEVGVYRISGSASDLAKLKKSFETNSYEAEQLLKEVDIHSVTGILKLYLRELPEALFTDALYPKFFQAFSQGPGSGGSEGGGADRQKELQKCFAQLPDLNKKCIDFLLNHFIRVNQHEGENKMSLHNLATVFGPTLLRPSTRPDSIKQKDLLAAGTVDVMAQAGILHCLLLHRQLTMRTNKEAS